MHPEFEEFQTETQDLQFIYKMYMINENAHLIQGKLYVFGGQERKYYKASNQLDWFLDYCTKAECLDMNNETGTWESLPQMPFAVIQPKIAHLGAQIYLMGDQKDEEKDNLCHFDATRKVWNVLCTFQCTVHIDLLCNNL